MRLIDADQLIKKYTECKEKHKSACSDWIFDAIILDLQSMPTINPIIMYMLEKENKNVQSKTN